MKRFDCCLSVFILLWNFTAGAQTITQLGAPFVQDDPRDLLFSADGSFITTGTKSANGILYKTDCSGNVIAQIEKSMAPSALEFFDAAELPDGSIVAVGYASLVQTPADTLDHLVLLKTDASLHELAFVHYPLLDKQTRGKSVAVGPDGTLLVFGDISGVWVDFWDMYFLRVNPFTLQPAGAPVIYNFGVDNAREIAPAGNNEFLLSGSSLTGNIFLPESLIINRLVTLKVNEQGAALWQYYYERTYKGKYGFCRSAGSVRHAATGNIMCAGTIYAGASDSLPDPVFILLNNQGVPLDTNAVAIPGNQNLYSTVPNSGDPGASLSLGETTHPGGPPSLLLVNPKEFDNQIVYAFFANDTLTPVSLRDIVEIPVNRFAFAGAIPDNPLNLALQNIIIATPEIDNIGILYQNCALTASFNAPNPSYQWYLNGVAIPGANSGVFFPEQSGLYQVQITDGIGCAGASDTLTVSLTTAGFYAAPSGGSYAFTNTSTGAASYKWDFGDGTTSTDVNPVHTYAASASFPVTLIAYGPCGNDTMTNLLVGATEAPAMAACRLFPNPNDGRFTVEISGEVQQTLTLSLCNAVGQVIERREMDFRAGTLRQTFDAGDLPPGVYTLQIRTSGRGRYLKVVKR